MKKYNNYFYYDPEGDGLEIVETLELAIERANDCIHEYLDGDGWMKEVDDVCVGVILQKSVQTDEVFRPPDSELDEEGWDKNGIWWGRQDDTLGTLGYDSIVDYKLQNVTPFPDGVLSLFSTDTLLDELTNRKLRVWVE